MVDDHGLRMTLVACRISAWGRYQWLSNQETLTEQEDIDELRLLRDWWLNIGIEKQEDIMKQAEELALQAPSTNKLWLANTKGVHSKGDYII